MFTILQTAQNGIASFLPILLIVVVFIFFFIIPNRKQQKEMRNFLNSLKKGDKVLVFGGIYATVVEVREESFLVEIDNGVKIQVRKEAIQKDPSASK